MWPISLVLATKGCSNLTITKLLLDHDAMVDLIIFDKHTPLLKTIQSNEKSKIVLLLKHKTDIHILDCWTRITLVHTNTSKNTTPKIIKILIASSTYSNQIQIQLILRK